MPEVEKLKELVNEGDKLKSDINGETAKVKDTKPNGWVKLESKDENDFTSAPASELIDRIKNADLNVVD